MSVLTEVLKLFKYDPATDGDMTFNIGQCMNDNWDKLDAAILLAIAAAGAYNPEESYAVGDYCTYKGKLRKCSTAIPTGEAWTEAHWTTTTVAAELAELSSQLSNKAERFGSTESLDDLIFLPSGFYQVNPPATNMPSVDFWFCILWSDNNTQDDAYYSKMLFAINANNDELWYLRITNSVKGKWTKVSNATPPQVRNLTMQSGFTADGDCTFFVTQESAVFLAGGVSGTLSANQDTQIGTLPADACPAAQCRRPAVTNNGPAYIDIHTDGTVWAHPFAAASQCWFDCSFVAEGGA